MWKLWQYLWKVLNQTSLGVSDPDQIHTEIPLMLKLENSNSAIGSVVDHARTAPMQSLKSKMVSPQT